MRAARQRVAKTRGGRKPASFVPAPPSGPAPKELGPVTGEASVPRLDRVPRASGGFIKKAIKNPGSFIRAAKRAGESTHAYAEEHKGDKGKLGRKARLDLTLEKLRPK